jgi:uncharacterized protein (DUF302 family)
MLFEIESNKSLEQIDADLRAAAARHSFGVLTVHDLQQTMRNKGVEFGRRVFIYEVCNPHKAKAVLETNGAVSTALPCRISVYEKETGFRIATLLPTEMMRAFGEPSLEPVAQEVEATMIAIMREAA